MAQIAITVPIALSLKSMWNFMNVIQVLAYLRFYSNWPAFLNMQFVQLEYAVTLKPISDPVMDLGKSKFEIASQSLSDESLKSAGVSDPEMFKTLGVFGLVIVLLLILLVIYFILKWVHKAIQTNKGGSLLLNTTVKIKDSLH